MATNPRPLPGWPRGLREELAAEYVGVSTGTLRTEVEAGRAPKPIWITAGRKVWLRDALDRWLDARAGGGKDHPMERPAEALVSEWDLACDGTGGTAVS